MGDEDKPTRRWDDVPGNFEWRLLHLEKQDDDKENRLRELESRMDVIDTKLDAIEIKTGRIDERTETWERDRFKNLAGFVATIFAVLATAIVGHFIK